MDVELGLVRAVEIATTQDVGRIINPLALEGQIQGGIAQGLGLALMEEIQMRDGRVQNARSPTTSCRPCSTCPRCG